MPEPPACPRCASPLMSGYGDLGEDVCGSCDGRLLSPELTRRVLIEEGGIPADTIKEMATHFGGQRLTCPACAGEMSPVTLKATPIDVCLGCGATFLDAGELSRLSRGQHHEALAPPQLVRPADTRQELDEAPADPRETWEKALPMYALEAVAVYAWVAHVRPEWTSLHTLGVSLGIIGVPLGLSMLVNVDWRSWMRSGRRGWGGGLGGVGRRNHAGGVVLFALAALVGGTISTINAAIAERLPQKLARRGAVMVLGGLAAWALLRAVVG